MDRVRYAVVGCGYIAQAAVLPAFRNARRNSELVALVSGDVRKRDELGRAYAVPIVADYDEYDELLRSGEVDAVYVALPNSMHHDFAVRAAHEGVHVLCEKPLATTSRDCQAMIDAAQDHGVKLMTAYRLHFERANLKAIELAEDGVLGDLRAFTGVFSMQVRRGNVRLKDDLGGGSVWDLGIYCLNAVRGLFRDEPEEVFAFTTHGHDARFGQVDEMTTAVLRFPEDRFATLVSSFGASDVGFYEVVGTKGSLRVDPAYEWAGDLEHHLTVEGRTTHQTFPRRDQFGPELLYFSDCVIEDRDPEPSGREGLADVRVIEAIYRSAETGRRIELPPFRRRRRPEPDQEIRRARLDIPDLVNAERPGRDD